MAGPLQYFYSSTWSDDAESLIGIDSRNGRVGIGSALRPPYASLLTVGGDITACNIRAGQVSVDNFLITSSNVSVGSNLSVARDASVAGYLTVRSNASIGSNLSCQTLAVSNTGYIGALACATLASSGNASIGGDLACTGTLSASQVSASNYLYRGSAFIDPADAKIDYNGWIKNGPPFDPDNGSLAVAGVVLGAAGLLTAVGGTLFNGQGNIGENLFDNLKDLLGDDFGEFGSNELYVPWSRVTYNPLLSSPDPSDKRAGFRSDAFILRGNSLNSLSIDDTEQWAAENRAVKGAFPSSSLPIIHAAGAGAHVGYLHMLNICSNVGSIQGAYSFNSLGLVATGADHPTINMRDRIMTLSNMRIGGRYEAGSNGSQWLDGAAELKTDGLWVGGAQVVGTNPIGASNVPPMLNARDRIVTACNVRVGAGKAEVKADGSVWVNGTEVIDTTGMYLGQIYARQIVPESVNIADLISLDMSPSPSLPLPPMIDNALYGTSALELELFGFTINPVFE